VKPILLIGGGGHCRSVIDLLESTGLYAVAGIVQRADADCAPAVLGYPVVGDDNALPALLKLTPCAIVTVGQIKEAALRIHLFERLRQLQAEIPVIASPLAYVSRHTQIGDGCVIHHGAVVNAGVLMGENCIINSQALLEHDVRIGDQVHISTGAKLNGGVTVGPACFVGSGAIIHQGVMVGQGSVIGAGCVVSRDVPPHSTIRNRR
jgi:sugar O-acyltransferase (sialic acid O-acetyltransferase NeuD family)